MNKIILLYSIATILIIFGVLGALISNSNTLIAIQILLGLVFLFSALVVSKFRIVNIIAQNIRQLILTKRIFKLLTSLSFIVVLVVVNYLAFKSTFRLDLTEQKIFSLSAETKQKLAMLDQKLEITALSPLRPNERQKVWELLKMLQSANPALINVRLFDAQSNPQLANQLKLAKHERVVLQTTTKEVRIASYAEEDLLHAITKLINQETTAVYYISGHSEPSLYSDTSEGLAKFRQVVENEVGSIKNLFLSESTSVPKDASLLVLVSNNHALTKAELSAIDDYLYQGGQLLVLIEPDSTNVLEFLATRGIKTSKAIVIDQVQKIFGTSSASFQITTRSFGNSQVLNNFSDTDLLSFVYATPLILDAEFVKARLVTGVVLTTSSAWGETQNLDLTANDLVVEKSTEDIQGPLVIGASFQGLENKLGKRAKMIVYGDASWVTNQYLDLYANSKLASQSINWLLADQRITTSPRTYRKSIILLSQSEISNMLLLSLILPQILLILGVCVWWWRNTDYVSA